MHFYYISNEFINYYNEFINDRPRALDMHDSEIAMMVGQILFELACMCRAQQMNWPNFLIIAVRYKYPTVSVQNL